MEHLNGAIYILILHGDASSAYHVGTCEKNIVEIQLWMGGDWDIGSYITFKNIQIEIGDRWTEYEPYIEPVTTNIYLDEPLRSNGEVADYIDFSSKKLVRKIGSNGEILDKPVVETIDLPDILTIDGTNIITVDTNIAPSKVEIEY